MGAFETTAFHFPRRKRLGYGKVIQNWGTTHQSEAIQSPEPL